MIVQVTLAIHTDDGIPVVLADERLLVAQGVADFEGTVARCAMTLDETVERATKNAQRQIRAYREAGPPDIADPRQ